MERVSFIEKTIKIINQLPENKVEEISDFAAFILKKYEESLLKDNIAELIEQSKSYDFLREDEVIYSISDVRLKYGNE
ncbi:hypothetical protein [Kaistella jeonii]|uniref:DUF2281 domain-containing protein n=1 Tax=Kaistella jeonii TaxID=266749 RepID=A0A0C1F2E1_9FLAO|nr:hypothetical protein [Kaistella jeonii]KIA86093.1 hypothetical protein OA86_13805 [Kaistella jeonii]SFC35181.1 hypothetical protein SAMN05421876_11545 [Kaistella jeonii]VEI95352.1 Uncharacterised protein [Kaistella jeonii]